MWICEKCGREFEQADKNHSCSGRPETIDDYIKAEPEEAQPFLNEVRDTLRKALPAAKERISWSMPTYWEKRNIIHFAAAKKHIGIYPGPGAVVHFSDRLSDYKTSKGAIQFPYSKPIPLDLIAEIAKWCYETGNHH